MPPPDVVHAIRHAVAISRLDHLRYVRIRGAGAFHALDRLCPGDLHVRDGQLLHSLLLDAAARPFADIYLGCDDEEYFLLAEGQSDGALAAHLDEHLRGEGVTWEDLTSAVGVVAFDGPYAWELLGLVAGQEAIGLPYLTFFHADVGLCYRAGKTGEFGYGLVVPRARLAELEQRAAQEGVALDAAVASVDDLDQCARENGYFNIRREGTEPVTPIELQLQWRVSYRKSYVGSDALARRRVEGPKERLTWLLGSGPWTIGDLVLLDGAAVGRIVNTGRSSVRGDWVGLALIDIAWAHAGISSFQVSGVGGATPARSVSPPVINNRSLFVSPQLHSYATRHDYTPPPVPRG